MTPWYWFWWSCFRIYFRLYHRGRIYHLERLPKTGGFILAPNHVSFLDPPFVGLTCNRAVTYFARDTLFRNPLARRWLRSWNAVPIKREGGDIGAMRLTLRLLAEGKAVMMFPEGTRSQDGELQLEPVAELRDQPWISDRHLSGLAHLAPVEELDSLHLDHVLVLLQTAEHLVRRLD